MRPRQQNIFYYLQLITQIGLTIVIPIILGILAGVYMDKRLGLKGIFTVAFLLIGIAGGFYSAYKQILQK
ncbi:MAG: AtpZ/AtpI family protein [Candidatus Omnitrophota bacterium]